MCITGVKLYSQDLKKLENNAFKPGEVLKWRFYYDAWLTGKVTAGIGVAEVKETDRTFFDREVYHIDTEGYSKGLFNLFFKVRDYFDSYIDKEALVPHLFIRRTREGGYVNNDDVYFNHFENRAISRSDTVEIPNDVFDIISSVYYARTLDYSDAEDGDAFPIKFLIDDSVYHSVIIYRGKEIIETRLGTFKCIKFVPRVVIGEVFDDPYPMTLWVTDDNNRIPVLGKSAVIVGSVKMELMEYSGLANPLTSKLDGD